MRKIENRHEANTIVIIVASKTHWRMLTLLGASLRRNQGMRNGVDLDWTDHQCLPALLNTGGRGHTTVLSATDSQESHSPSWGRYTPFLSPPSQFGVIYLVYSINTDNFDK